MFIGTFNNKGGTGKQKARNLIINAIKNSDTTKSKILTLPAEDFEIEKLLFTQVSKKINFLMCESKPLIYKKLIAKANNFFTRMPAYYCGFIGDKIYEARENEYSHLILDYCGQIASFADEILFAMNNKIVEVDGTISLTFNKRITGTQSKKFVELMELLNPQTLKSKTNVIKDEPRTEHSILTFFNRNGGMNYAIENVFSYKDTAAMFLVIIRRIK